MPNTPAGMLSKQRILKGLGLGLRSSWVCCLFVGWMPLATAQIAGEGVSENGYLHSNGIIWGLQKTSGSSAREHSLYFLDTGTLQSSRRGRGRNETSKFRYTLGAGPASDQVGLIDVSSSWERNYGAHLLNLNLLGDAEVYLGSALFASLENQFILQDGFAFGGKSSQRIGGEISLVDRIRLTQTMALTLDVSRRENKFDLPNQIQNSSRLDSYQLKLEQQWGRGGWQASVDNASLTTRLQPVASTAATRVMQTVTDSQARLLFPLASHLEGSLGWQDLRSQTDDGRAGRSLHGPEVGLNYGPVAAWRANLLLRVLDETGNPDRKSEVFGLANISWQGDSRNEFVISADKQIDLQARYRVVRLENSIFADSELSSQSKVLQWNHQGGRQKLAFSVKNSRQISATRADEQNDFQLTHTYSLTRRSDLVESILLRRSTSERQLFDAELRLAWQQLLTEGFQPSGGHSFLRVEAGFERFSETTAKFNSERLVIMLSLGQLGNFDRGI